MATATQVAYVKMSMSMFCLCNNIDVNIDLYVSLSTCGSAAQG